MDTVSQSSANLAALIFSEDIASITAWMLPITRSCRTVFVESIFANMLRLFVNFLTSFLALVALELNLWVRGYFLLSRNDFAASLPI